MAVLLLPLAGCADRASASPDGSCAGVDVTMSGTSGDDVLEGTPGRDVIWGGDGDDRIEGLGGNDVLCGGPGADRLSGGQGDDVVDGGTDLRFAVDTEAYEWEGDRLSGGSGDDTVVTGPQGDHDPVDELTFATAGHRVSVDLSAGTAEGEGQDRITGQVGVLVGSPGPDRLVGSERGEEIRGGRGADRIDGRGGDDRLDGAGVPRVETTPGEGRDVAPNHLVGGDGNDEITGAEGDDTLEGGDGDDALYGDLGADRLEGGPGADSLADYVVAVSEAGAGRQYLDGGADRDRLQSPFLQRPEPRGGDTVFTDGTGTLDLAAGRLWGRVAGLRFDVPVRSFEDADTPRGTWTVYGTDGPNQIIATDEKRPVTIYARGGDDQLAGTFRDDLLDGGPGNDEAGGYVGRDRYVSVEKIRR